MALELKNYDPAIMAGANIGVAVDLTDITDANGNEVIEIDGNTSAVNYVRVSNAATSSNPEISAQGDDSNVSLQLTPLGTGIVLLGSTSTGTIVNGSATINAQRGMLTTASLTTGTAAATTFDLKSNKIGTSSQLQLTLFSGSNTGGLPVLGQAVIGVAGSATITVVNADSSPAGTALNGTLKIAFVVLN